MLAKTKFSVVRKTN